MGGGGTAIKKGGMGSGSLIIITSNKWYSPVTSKEKIE